jgi:hypothetical protein
MIQQFAERGRVINRTKTCVFVLLALCWVIVISFGPA